MTTQEQALSALLKLLKEAEAREQELEAERDALQQRVAELEAQLARAVSGAKEVHS